MEYEYKVIDLADGAIRKRGQLAAVSGLAVGAVVLSTVASLSAKTIQVVAWT